MKTQTTLQITECKISPIEKPQGKTMAFVRVILNDQMQLTGMRIVNGVNGLFLAYPNDPEYKGNDCRSIFYPITRELRESMEHMVLTKYQEVLDNG